MKHLELEKNLCFLVNLLGGLRVDYLGAEADLFQKVNVIFAIMFLLIVLQHFHLIIFQFSRGEVVTTYCQQVAVIPYEYVTNN